MSFWGLVYALDKGMYHTWFSFHYGCKTIKKLFTFFGFTVCKEVWSYDRKLKLSLITPCVFVLLSGISHSAQYYSLITMGTPLSIQSLLRACWELICNLRPRHFFQYANIFDLDKSKPLNLVCFYLIYFIAKINNVLPSCKASQRLALSSLAQSD